MSTRTPRPDRVGIYTLKRVPFLFLPGWSGEEHFRKTDSASQDDPTQTLAASLKGTDEAEGR
jgi:hypothetical protein